MRKLSGQDISFLCSLQNELLTQPTDGNCGPRFWAVGETKRIIGLDEEYARGWLIYDGENCADVGKPDDIESVIQELTDKESYGFDSADFIGCTTPEEVVEKVEELRTDGTSPLTVVWYDDVHSVHEDTMFLTKKDCAEHIEKYGYNYNQPHTFVMTAERSPSYEKLMEILKNVDFAVLAEKGEKSHE